MTVLGIALLLVGAVLLVAVAHAPGGVLRVTAEAALISGGILLITSISGGAAFAVPVGVGLGLIAEVGGSWRRARPRARALARQGGCRVVAGTPLVRLERPGVGVSDGPCGWLSRPHQRAPTDSAWLARERPPVKPANRPGVLPAVAATNADCEERGDADDDE